MTTQEAMDFLGGRRQLAELLGIWPQVIYSWGDEPPMARQYELQVKTDGALKARKDAANGVAL